METTTRCATFKVLGLTLLVLSSALLLWVVMQFSLPLLTSVSWNALASVSWNG